MWAGLRRVLVFRPPFTSNLSPMHFGGITRINILVYIFRKLLLHDLYRIPISIPSNITFFYKRFNHSVDTTAVEYVSTARW